MRVTFKAERRGPQCLFFSGLPQGEISLEDLGPAPSTPRAATPSPPPPRVYSPGARLCLCQAEDRGGCLATR